MESFFRHFKDELDYREAHNLCELKEIIDQYMKYFNTTRKQWIVPKMTPEQYRSHQIAKSFLFNCQLIRAQFITKSMYLSTSSLIQFHINY